MRRLKPFIRFVPAGILAFSLMGVYLATLAPGLTWANYGSDGGDFIAAAVTGGVAHPTGYPVYLLLARLFQFLPVGSLAFRTNLMSVLAAVLTAVLVYALVTRAASPFSGHRNWLAGLASAYAFGLSPLLWSQAVITEVYALHALFVASILYFFTDDLSVRFAQERLDRFLGILAGLAIGNHLTSVLLLPILFSTKFSRNPGVLPRTSLMAGWQLDIRGLLCRLTWLGIGLLAYLSLPLRSLANPPINWGNPVTLDGFAWLVSGKLYQDDLFVLTLSSVWERCQVIAALFLGQFGVFGLVLGLVGLIIFFKPSHLFLATIWIVVAFSAFSIIYATYDSFLYLIPVFLCFAIWIGMGLAGLMNLFSQRFRKVGIALGLAFILILFVQAGSNWSQVDASQDLRAEQFGREVLNQAPSRAIVFAKGDRAVFTLWYFHIALQNRPDLAVVAVDLLHFDWYQRTLRSSYPDLSLPGPFPFATTVVAANPGRPVCYVEDLQLPQIQCLPDQVP
jgi:hypothetical protein